MWINNNNNNNDSSFYVLFYKIIKQLVGVLNVQHKLVHEHPTVVNFFFMLYISYYFVIEIALAESVQLRYKLILFLYVL